MKLSWSYTCLACRLSRAAVWNQPGSQNELMRCWTRVEGGGSSVLPQRDAHASSLIKCVRALHASRSKALWLSFIYLFILDLTLFHLFTCKAQTSECWVCSFVHFLGVLMWMQMKKIVVMEQTWNCLLDIQSVGTVKLDLLFVKETFSLVAPPFIMSCYLLDLMVCK